MIDRLRYRMLRWWSRLVSRRPGYVLFVAISLAVAAAAISFMQLRFQSDRNRLIADDIDWNRWFIDWRDSFMGKHDLIVVVDAAAGGEVEEKHRRRAETVVRDLATRLEADDRHVSRVVWGFDASRVSPRAIRTLDAEGFNLRIEEIEQARLLLESGTPTDLMVNVAAMARSPTSLLAAGAVPEGLARLAGILDAFHAVVTAEGGATPSLAALVEGAASPGVDWQYLDSQPDGRLLFLRVSPLLEAGAINAQQRAMEGIRRHIAEVAARHPGIEMGLTGLEAVEADETTAATRDSTVASVVAFVLIAALLVTAFHSWRVPLLALVALVVGIMWTFGFVTIAVGHLQVVSVVFFVILLGLGIGYGIHLASRLELIRHRYPDGPEGFEVAMRNSLTATGPGIITGAVTTAAAFVTTLFTDFKGVGEMGLIAAGGIMLCLLSMFSVFPALLRLTKSRHKHFRPMASRWFHLFEEHWVLPFASHPWPTVIAALVLTVCSLLAVTGMRFNYNLMDLQPSGAESVRWEKRIAKLSGRSVYSAVCIVASLEDARRLTEAVRPLNTVDDVGGAGWLFPSDDAEKRRRLIAVRKRLAPALASAAEPIPGPHGPLDVAASADFLRGLEGLEQGLAPAARLTQLNPQVGAPFSNVTASVGQLIAALKQRATPGDLGRLFGAYATWRHATARRVESALDVGALAFDDLPADVMRPYRDAAGRYALEIYPDTRSERYQSPLDPDFLPRFVSEIRRTIDRLYGEEEAAPPLTRGIHEAIRSVQEEGRDPAVAPRPILTGPMIQFYESGRLVLRSYQAAGGVALGVVFLLVLADLKRPADALLALLPVGIGFALTFGVMRVFDMSVNPANIIVLPLMFGIGVDAGVHMMHRFRQDEAGRPLGLTDGTGKGIAVTSLTAMIGFAALMVSSHRGLFGLGMVMALGIALTMIACLTVMPAMLELMYARRDPDG